MYTRNEIMKAWETHVASVPGRVEHRGGLCYPGTSPGYFLDWLNDAGYLVTSHGRSCPLCFEPVEHYDQAVRRQISRHDLPSAVLEITLRPCGCTFDEKALFSSSFLEWLNAKEAIDDE